MGETDRPPSLLSPSQRSVPIRPLSVHLRLTEFPPLSSSRSSSFSGPGSGDPPGPLPAAGGAVAAARPRSGGPRPSVQRAGAGPAVPAGGRPSRLGRARGSAPGPRRDAKAMAQPPLVSRVACADAQARGGASRSGLAGGHSGCPAGRCWRPGVALGVGRAVRPWTGPVAAALGSHPWPNT